MRLAVLFLVFFVGFAVCQFEQAVITLPNINLVSTSTIGRHSEFAGGVASNNIANNDCRRYVHTVTNVQTSNGPQNSGTYFSVQFVVATSAVIEFTFTEPNSGFQFGGGVQSCGPSTTCNFDYLCDIFPSSNTLEINVWATNTFSATEIVTYDVTVTQYVEQIDTISNSRTLSINSPISGNTFATNLGPENFVHFYHNLVLSAEELALSSTLYVIIDDYTGTAGSGVVCVDLNQMAASTAVLPGTSNGFDANGNPIGFPGNGNLNAPTAPCTTFCGNGVLSAGSFYVGFDATDICTFLGGDMWIGVNFPAADTFDVTISFDTARIPIITSALTASNSLVGRLSETCDIGNGDFSCTDYYLVSPQNINFNVPDTRLGPVLDIELFGAQNGNFEVSFSQFVGGPAASPCGAAIRSCSVTATGFGGTRYCELIFCDFDDSDEYIISVFPLSVDNNAYNGVYSLDVSVISWPLEVVDLSQPRTYFGSVNPGHYEHYEVAITTNDIFTDSFFYAEMYPANPIDDQISFGWNFNALAGAATGCYSSIGSCTTNTDCNDYDSSFSGNTVQTFCRFAFLPCGIDSGSDFPRSAELKAGTYYFAVWGTDDDSENQHPTVDYTLNFNLRRSVVLFDNLPQLGSVYSNEPSVQYFATVPEDESIIAVLATISNVRNGDVQLFGNCARPAGSCPCYTSRDSCVAVSASNLGSVSSSREPHTCTVSLSRCACEAGIFYFGTEYLGTSQPFDSEKPAFYTIAVSYTVYEDFNEIAAIGASRAGALVVDTVYYENYYNAFEGLDQPSSHYYKIFTNGFVGANDALFATLTASQDVIVLPYLGPQRTLDRYELTLRMAKDHLPGYVPGLVKTSEYGDDFFGSLISGCDFEYCSIELNNDQDPYAPGANSGLNIFADCTVTFYQCRNGCGNSEAFRYDPNAFFYATVRMEHLYNDENNYGFYLENGQLSYSLDIQIVDQTPKTLTDGLIAYDSVGSLEYLHFVYDVSSTPANAQFNVEVYRDDKDQTMLSVYVNYWNGLGTPVLAGKTVDCYDSILCNPCVLSGSNANFCGFSVPPCELASQSGSYYISVQSEDSTSYRNSNSRYSPYETYLNAGLERLQYKYQQDDSDFTVEAYIKTVTEIFPGGVATPTIGNIFEGQNGYFSLTAPATAPGLAGYVLRMTFTTYEQDLPIYLSTSQPDDVCGTCLSAVTVASFSNARFRRTPCERESNIYYLFVDGSDLDANCADAGFSISAFTEPISQIAVSLTSVSAPPSRVNAAFDSTTSTNPQENSITVAAGEYKVISFTLNPAVGEHFSITIGMDTPTIGNPDFEVYVSRGNFVIPPTAGNDFGLPASQAQCPSTVAAPCTNVDENNACVLHFDPCDIDSNNNQWFITLAGDNLPPKTSTAVINILLQKYSSPSIVAVPAVGDFVTTASTSVTLDDVDYPFFSFQTSSTLGLSGGESIDFTITGNAIIFEVSIGSEVGGSCGATCSDSGGVGVQSCSVFACEAISAQNWFFYITAQSNVNPVAIEILRNAAAGSTTNVQPVQLNTVENVAGFTTVGQANSDYQYYSFTIPASSRVNPSSTAAFFLESTGIPDTNFYFFDQGQNPVFIPGFTFVSATEVALYNSGTTANTCGGSNIGLPTGDCCFDQTTYTFAIRDEPVPGGSFIINYRTLLGSTNNLALGVTTAGAITDTDRVEMYSFSIPSGNDIYFDFSTDAGAGNMEIFLARDSVAGSADARGNTPPSPIDARNAGYCWGNDDVVGFTVCPGPFNGATSCSATLPTCTGCLNIASSGQTTFTFAVTGTAGSTFTLLVAATPTQTGVSTGSNLNLQFPINSQIQQDSTPGPNSLWSNYVYTYSRGDPSNVPNFVPTNQFTGNPDYPHVTFTFNNFRDSTQAPVNPSTDVTFFINNNGPAGNNVGCLGGSLFSGASAQSVYPCMENLNGAPTIDSTSVVCSVSVCDLNCGDEIYFGITKSVASLDTYAFDLQITENFNDLINNNLVEVITFNQAQTSSITRAQQDNNEFVYVRTTTNVQPGQFLEYSFTPTVEATGTTTVLNFNSVDAATCTSGTSVTPCGPTVTTGNTCVYLSDICTSETVDTNFPTYFVVSRSSGTGAWGFTFEISVNTISALDVSATTLSVSNPSYSATKEIEDLTWQFFAFNIPVNDGYSWLDVTFDNVNCQAAAASLEIYASWGTDIGAFPFTDSALPNKWPASSCNADSDTFGTFNSFSMGTCQFNGGVYRVSVFAEVGDQIFPTPATLTGPVPVTYDVSAQLNSLDFVTMDSCPFTTDVQRVEINIMAQNRGYEIIFRITDVPPGTDFFVSRNSYPQQNGFCDFSALDRGVETCNTNLGTSCSITIDRCEMIDGRYFAYFSSASATISYETTTDSWIPVIDSVANSGDTFGGILHRDVFQYYQIRTDSRNPFIAHFSRSSEFDCESNCDFTVAMFQGSRSNGFGNVFNGDSFDPFNECEECDDDSNSCPLDDDDGCFFTVTCPNFDNYYFGITSDDQDSDDDNCGFDFTVTDVGSLPNTVLIENQPLCITDVSPQTFSITNIPANSEVSVTSTSSVFYSVGSSTCMTAGTNFVVDGCDLAPGDSILIFLSTDLNLCDDEDLTISYATTASTVTALSSGSPGGVADFGTFTTQGNFMVSDADMVATEASTPPGPSCAFGCSRVLSPNTQYYITPSTITLNPVNLVTLTGTPVAQTLSGGAEILYFSYVLPAGTNNVNIWVENVEYSPFDFGANPDLDDIDMRAQTSFDAPPTMGCGATCTAAFNSLVDVCNNDYSPLSVPVSHCDGTTLFVSLTICQQLVCPVSFTVRVTSTQDSNFSTASTNLNHNAAFTTVTQNGINDCSSSFVATETVLVDVVDILLVSLRNPLGGPASTTATSCAGANTCAVSLTDFGTQSTCATQAGDSCASAYCRTPGTYEVTISPNNPGPASVEYQIINSWVDFSDSVSNTIYGRTAHFYRLTNSDTALTIDFNIVNGPALSFQVFAGCSSSAAEDWQEKTICAFGTCSTYVPTAAKQSGAGNLYIIVESNEYLTHSTPENANGYVKPTSYSIIVTRGISNCQAPPTSGFCADSSFAGVNVWSSISNDLVWGSLDQLEQDSRAQCLYNDLIDTCPSPTVECKQFLKILACLNTFPQCDENGYQLGVCEDICNQVESVCGLFYERDDDDFNSYDCRSPKYMDGSAGTCYTNIPINIPPTPVDPLSFFNDDDDDGTYGLPGTLYLPNFPPQYAQIPSFRNDDDDGVGNLKNVVNIETSFSPDLDSSAASLLFYPFFVLIICALLV